MFTKSMTTIASISLAIVSLNNDVVANDIVFQKPKQDNVVEISDVRQPFYTRSLPANERQVENDSKADEEQPQNQSQKLYQLKGCNACHGFYGKTPSQPLYPKVAGQNQQYIIAQMQDFKTGARHNGLSAVMRGGLSPIKNEDEIKIIAEWLASLTIEVDITETDRGAQLYKSKNCHGCHGDKANNPIYPNYPKLAGQNYKYAIAQMKDIKKGKRQNGSSVVMKGIMSKLNDDEISLIAKWLESIEKQE